MRFIISEMIKSNPNVFELFRDDTTTVFWEGNYKKAIIQSGAGQSLFGDFDPHERHRRAEASSAVQEQSNASAAMQSSAIGGKAPGAATSSSSNNIEAPLIEDSANLFPVDPEFEYLFAEDVNPANLVMEDDMGDVFGDGVNDFDDPSANWPPAAERLLPAGSDPTAGSSRDPPPALRPVSVDEFSAPAGDYQEEEALQINVELAEFIENVTLTETEWAEVFYICMYGIQEGEANLVQENFYPVGRVHAGKNAVVEAPVSTIRTTAQKFIFKLEEFRRKQRVAAIPARGKGGGKAMKKAAAKPKAARQMQGGGGVKISTTDAGLNEMQGNRDRFNVGDEAEEENVNDEEPEVELDSDINMLVNDPSFRPLAACLNGNKVLDKEWKKVREEFTTEAGKKKIESSKAKFHREDLCLESLHLIDLGKRWPVKCFSCGKTIGEMWKGWVTNNGPTLYYRGHNQKTPYNKALGPESHIKVHAQSVYRCLCGWWKRGTLWTTKDATMLIDQSKLWQCAIFLATHRLMSEAASCKGRCTARTKFDTLSRSNTFKARQKANPG
ncbi:unnamed protein product [Amoebophrya sp. A25]|nr:unnamed protein product [Amoebophrya sp. A25]|eukprot:GSA25T00020314001.1